MKKRILLRLGCLPLVLFCTHICVTGYAQNRISLKEIPALVETNLPRLQATRANAEAIRNTITSEKQTLIPDLTLGYQANIATYNNITGMSYPGLIMPISGPPSAVNNINFVPGSAATALLNWRPVTFGQRNAAVERATSQYKLANAAYNEELFRFQYMAVNAYMEAVFYQQIMGSHRANISRYSSSLEQSLALAKNGLRPGIDTTQLQSSIAQAEIDLLQTENNLTRKLLEVSALTGMKGQSVNINPSDTSFNITSDFAIDTVLNTTSHPLYQAAQAQQDFTEAQLNEIEKSWRPKLDIWGNVYGRGSGIDALGNTGSEGFNLTRHNLGVGIQLSFPLLQFYQVNTRKKQFQQLVRADEHRKDQVALELRTQSDIALQQYRSNLLIADKTRIRLKSAAEAYQSLQLSYEAGLVDFTRLAQAQFELQQAEINNASSKLVVWRSLLDMSIAKGDLNIFFQQIK